MERSEVGHIGLQQEAHVATITIHRPHVRNAMNRAMWVEIRRAFESVSREESDVRVLVVKGAAGNFCAGSDIKEMQGRTTQDAESTFRLVEEALEALEKVPVPVIGALSGVAAGGGCELLLASDLRVAAASARIGMPVARLGITVSPAFIRRLVRAVGESRAGDLLVSGRLIGAEEAYTWGLAHYLVADGAAEETAKELALRIATYSPASLRHSKRLLRGLAQLGDGTESHPVGSPPNEAHALDAHRFLGNPEEFWEGVSAFIEKREPNF